MTLVVTSVTFSRTTSSCSVNAEIGNATLTDTVTYNGKISPASSVSCVGGSGVRAGLSAKTLSRDDGVPDGQGEGEPVGSTVGERVGDSFLVFFGASDLDFVDFVRERDRANWAHNRRMSAHDSLMIQEEFVAPLRRSKRVSAGNGRTSVSSLEEK